MHIWALEAIEADWKDGAKKCSDKKWEDNPNCIILTECCEAGGDINQLSSYQSLRKSEDGTWECVPATKGDLKPGQWLANQRKERKRGRGAMSGVRIRALEASHRDRLERWGLKRMTRLQ